MKISSQLVNVSRPKQLVNLCQIWLEYTSAHIHCIKSYQTYTRAHAVPIFSANETFSMDKICVITLFKITWKCSMCQTRWKK